MDPEMSRTVKLKRKLDGALQWLRAFLPLANCHMVSYITDNCWETHVPKSIRNEIEQSGFVEAEDFIWRVQRSSEDADSEPPDAACFTSLSAFLIGSRLHRVRTDGDVCLTREEFALRTGAAPSHHLIEEFMNPKKAHEVHEMSSSVARISLQSGATHCIDVGGGKGYLSAALAMLHGLKVLGVDCSRVNARAAQIRQDKLEKKWPALLRKSRSSEGPSGAEPVPRQSYAESYKRAVCFITHDTDLTGLISDCFGQDCQPRICLTGLHTCGDLGASSLRLFAGSPSVVSIMNVPCCYNRLSETVQDQADLWFPLEDIALGLNGNECGFPMSTYLKDSNFSLGRNARMLSAQPFHRVIGGGSLSTLKIFYRALLQVILKEQFDLKTTPEDKLRGLAEKCADFKSYAAAALEKLNFPPCPDGRASELNREHARSFETMNVFQMFRLCLAPVIENVILLDRLLFLAELNFPQSYLVRLFDPVVSPRCYALVAMKSTNK